MTELEERSLINCVDLMFVSDHGMTPTDCGNTLYLETFGDIQNRSKIFTGTVGRLRSYKGEGK